MELQHETSTNDDPSFSVQCVTQTETTVNHETSTIETNNNCNDSTIHPNNKDSDDDESHLFPLHGTNNLEGQDSMNTAGTDYLGNDKAPQVLLSMHIGMPTSIENVQILHFDHTFFLPLKKKEYYPEKKHLIAEINRR